MLFNYLKLSLRLLVRNPFFTAINILCLSIGFTVFILCWPYAQNELNSDQFYPDYNSIYRVYVNARWTDNKIDWKESLVGATPPNPERILSKYIPIRNSTSLFGQCNFVRSALGDHAKDVYLSHIDEAGNRQSIIESKVAYAAPNFFSFFSIPIIKGDQENPLSLANAVVLSEKTAHKYFGKSDPIGKFLLLNDTIPLIVTAVFENFPHHTHLNFDIAISMERIKRTVEDGLVYTYIKSDPDIDVHALWKKMNELSKNELQAFWCANCRFMTVDMGIQPLHEIAFENFRAESHVSKSKSLLQTISMASILILIMAWINYINLTLSSGKKRFKEIAARVTVGAQPGDIVSQFMTESIVINVISFFVALTFIQLFGTTAELFLEFYKPSWDVMTLSTYLTIILAAFVSVLVTGLYPALVTLKRNPKNLLNTSKKADSPVYISSILTTFQFTGAVIMIVWIFTMYQQMNYIIHKDIGISIDHVIVVDLPVIPTPHFNNDIDNLSQKFAAMPGVESYTVCHFIGSVKSENLEDGQTFLQMKVDDPGIVVDSNGGVDENFVPFFKIKMLAGRNFRAGDPSDQRGILISRATMVRLGIHEPKDAIGLRLQPQPLNDDRTRTSGIDPENRAIQAIYEPQIIGVFEDYLLRPLLNQGYLTYGLKPGIALLYKDHLDPGLRAKAIAVRINSGDQQKIINSINKAYAEIFPGTSASLHFLEDEMGDQYQSAKVSQNQILFFTFIAIGIACLGLLGMISSKVVEKTKEIGIRKVMGAKMHHIGQVLLKTTINQVVMAIVMGVPLAYYLSHQYLSKFTEQVSLSWWYYVIPIFLLMGIMLATIASLLIKASRTNPVESLRYE